MLLKRWVSSRNIFPQNRPLKLARAEKKNIHKALKIRKKVCALRISRQGNDLVSWKIGIGLKMGLGRLLGTWPAMNGFWKKPFRLICLFYEPMVGTGRAPQSVIFRR